MNCIRLTYVALVLLFAPFLNLHGQNRFQLRLDDPDTSLYSATAILERANGEIIVAGQAYSAVQTYTQYPTTPEKAFIARLSPAGSAHWVKRFGAQSQTLIRDLDTLSTGIIAFGGMVEDMAWTETSFMYLGKIDLAGNVSASRYLMTHHGAFDIDVRPNDNIHLSGAYGTLLNSASASSLAITDSSGVSTLKRYHNLLFSNYYAFNRGGSVTPDGGFVGTGQGFVYTGGVTPAGIYLSRNLPSGASAFFNCYGSALLIGVDVVPHPYGGYYLLFSGNGVFGLARINNLGAVVWAKNISGLSGDLNKLLTEPDGEVLLTCNQPFNTPANTVHSGVVVKLDSTGNLRWARKYGNTTNDFIGINKMIVANDGGYLIAGEFSNAQGREFRPIIIKTDTLGFSGCSESTPSITVNPFSLAGPTPFGGVYFNSYPTPDSVVTHQPTPVTEQTLVRCSNVACPHLPYIQSNGPVFCSSGTLNATNLSLGATSTQWWVNGTPAGTSSTLSYPLSLPPGTYPLTMTSGNGTCSATSTINLSIPVQGTPTASFSAASGGGLTVNFTNLSTGSPAAYSWSFGDGFTSTAANPSHTYFYTSNFNVCLTAYDTCGTSTYCTTVQVCTAPNLNFQHTVNGLTASFGNLSTGATSGYLWNFGDGTTSTQFNTAHTYSNPGTYNVCLTASNSCGPATLCQQVTIACTNTVPNAAFNFNVNPSNPQNVSFNSQSTGTITGLLWSLGDGNTSTLANVNHTYSVPGIYNVCLIALNGCARDTLCQQVVAVCQPVVVNPTVTQVQNTTFAFYPVGASNAVWAQWNFGDGATSTSMAPMHGYAAPGTYNVCLILGNPCSIDTACITVTATCSTTTPAFTYTQNINPVTFTNQTPNYPTSCLWDFGDGNTSTQFSPVHTYSANGTYNVCLIVTDTCYIDTVCQTVQVSCPPGTAAFTHSSSLLTATFTNQSTGSNQSWLWDFGDGNTSAQQNPVHTFNAPGTYQVCLTLTTACNTQTICQSVSVTCPQPVAGFTYSSTDLTTTFTNTSTSATAWSWNFGDGTSSALANPVHQFPAPGTYQVCLTATNGNCGSSTSCQWVTVNCSVVANFTYLSNFDTTFFNALPQLYGATYTWDFGDGNTGSGNPVQHVYANPGNYTVCLVVTNVCGSDTNCYSITANSAPQANFNYTAVGTAVNFNNLSTGSNLSYLWAFGSGGATSTQVNPSFNYPAPGNYQVCLTASNPDGSDSTCQTLNLTVSANDPALAQTVTLYPNPARDEAMLVTTERLVAVRLTELTGRLMMQWKEVTRDLRMDLSRLPAGIYLVETENTSGQKQAIRLVKE